MKHRWSFLAPLTKEDRGAQFVIFAPLEPGLGVRFLWWCGFRGLEFRLGPFIFNVGAWRVD